MTESGYHAALRRLVLAPGRIAASWVPSGLRGRGVLYEPLALHAPSTGRGRSPEPSSLRPNHEESAMGDKSPKDKAKNSKRKTAQTKKDADAAKAKAESGAKKP